MTNITVTGTYQSQGSPLSGNVTFTPVATADNNTVTFIADPVSYPVVGGALSAVVLTTDSYGQVEGAITYRVVERIGSTFRRKFYVALPSSLGSSVNLASLTTYPDPPNTVVLEGGDPTPVDLSGHLATTHAAQDAAAAAVEARVDALEAVPPVTDYIPESLVNAKGDLPVADAADSVTRLGVGTNGQVLTADSAQTTGMKWATPSVQSAIAPTIVDAKGDLIAGTASDAVARQAVGSNGQVLTADSAQSTGMKWAAVPADTTKADKTGALTQFSDVSDTAPGDGAALVYDSGTGQYEPTVLDTTYAQVDANNRLDSANWPQGFIPTVVLEATDPIPSWVSNYSLVGRLPAAPSLVPILLDIDSVRAANNVVLQLAEAVAIDEYLGFTIGWENSTGLDHFSFAFGGTGAGTGTADFGTLSIPNTTAGVLNGFVKLTGAASAGSTVTITARDVANAAINRAHLIACIYKLPNLIASAPRDTGTQASGGNSSSTNLTSIQVAAAGATAQASEVAIGSVVNSSNPAPDNRDVNPTGAWSLLAKHKSDNTSSARTLMVAYQPMTTIGTPTLTTQVTVTEDGTAPTTTGTGTWAGKLDTYKGLS